MSDSIERGRLMFTSAIIGTSHTRFDSCGTEQFAGAPSKLVSDHWYRCDALEEERSCVLYQIDELYNPPE